MNYSYLRLSTSEDTQTNSFDVQTKHITAKYSIDQAFKDTLSGSTPFDKRIGWKELMSVLTNGDNIIIHRLDRLSRSTMNYLVAEEQLKKMGVSLIFVEGASNEDTAEAQLMRVMLSAMAEFERSMIRTRIKQTKEHQKSLGKFLGGKKPFGFTVADGALVEDPQEQTIIQRIDSLRSDGLSFAGITRELTNMMMFTRNGKPFTNTQVMRIVQRE